MSALDADAIGAALRTLAYGRSLDVRAQTRSTNDDARAAADEGAPRGHVVVADTQSAGRGSRGRTWSSPAGVDLYLSIVERVPLPLAKIPPLTLAVGLGVADAVDALVGAGRARVKWPNDVRVDEKKCAGILVETSSAGHKPGPIILGVGLGVNRTEWESELSAIATSLRVSRGARDGTLEELDRALVLATLLAHVERRVDRFVVEGPEPIIAELEPRLAWRGERVRIDGVEGELVGLTREGALRVRGARGLETVLAGTLERV